MDDADWNSHHLEKWDAEDDDKRARSSSTVATDELFYFRGKECRSVDEVHTTLPTAKALVASIDATLDVVHGFVVLTVPDTCDTISIKAMAKTWHKDCGSSPLRVQFVRKNKCCT